MIQAKIEEGIEPPEPRVLSPSQRLSRELKEMEPGRNVLLSKSEAKTFRSYGRYRGWRTVQKQEAGENGEALVRVWRLE